MSNGVVAAGHPLTAEVGADVLRDGGNAVDAAVAAMLASFAAEPLLTGLGAGGYMLVVPPGESPVLLDFFVEASGRGLDPAARAPLAQFMVSFGDAEQSFHAGASSCGAYGTPAGACEAVDRFGSRPLSDLVAPAARLAREGVPLNRQQAYVVEILEAIVTGEPEGAALFAPGGRRLVDGDVLAQPELADSLERLGAEGSAPFYSGDIAEAVVSFLAERGGWLSREDLASYKVEAREPIHLRYRGLDIVTNPPLSAGGTLIAFSLGLLDTDPAPPSVEQLVTALEAAQDRRTSGFLRGLADPGFLRRFLGGSGNTTHISVLDRDGMACSVTCTNGEGSGVVVPGTGIHLNNMLGEEDLNPLGFHRHPPGRKLPSMMAPTAVVADGRAEVALGSAGSNRIRSAIIQTIVGIVDRGLDVAAAVEAPRLHVEDGVLYSEPGLDLGSLESSDRVIQRFRSLNLFFGGVQAVRRDPATGELSGAGDPRRGGAVALA